MNTGWISELVARCQATELWRRLSNGNTQALSTDQVALVVFADHVETWIRELETIMLALSAEQSNDYHPQCAWPVQAWLAYYDGRLSAIDISSNGKLASIGCFARDNTPRFLAFLRLFDQACDLCYKLKQQHGLAKPADKAGTGPVAYTQPEGGTMLLHERAAA